MYVNNIEPEMFLPPGSESFNHNATRTTSSRSMSNNVNNNIVPVYYLILYRHESDIRRIFMKDYNAEKIFLTNFLHV